jgi:light-regulated signal transduction histidine kinase (bacteriophytochrome)
MGGKEAVKFGDGIQQAAARMETLIRDLLEYSRTVQPEKKPSEPADLSDSLAEAISVLKGYIDEIQPTITIDPLPTVMGDWKQLAHVFQNLLSNALKYRKTDVPLAFRVRAQLHENLWVVSVTDNGVGSEQQYAERVFGLFKRLHGSEYPGTGVGLAICQRVIERYGGRMWAESALGIGSSFFFELPAVQS